MSNEDKEKDRVVCPHFDSIIEVVCPLCGDTIRVTVKHGFILTDTQKKVVKILEAHEIASPVPLEQPRALTNLGAINFMRRVRIASVIAKRPTVSYRVIHRKARGSSMLPKYLKELLAVLVGEGIVEESGEEGKKKYTWKGK